MITSWTQICKEVSTELNIPLEEVKEEILKYTLDCREAAIEMKNTEIYLFGLGVFRIRKVILRNFIDRLDNRIKRLTTKEFSNKERKLEDYSKRLSHLRYLQSTIEKVFSSRKSNIRRKT